MLGVILTPCALAAADPKGPEPLPEDLIRTWKDAKADARWLGTDPYGTPRGGNRPEDLFRVDVPGFCITGCKAGVLAKLPIPGKPFGLILTGSGVTDDVLKELVGFKSLTTLWLEKTAVTAGGLKNLLALKNLTALHLTNTLLTKEHCKELAAFTNLTALGLAGTDVTDAGIQELKLDGFKNLTLLNLGSCFYLTEKCLKELAPLKNLTMLSINGMAGAELKELAGLRKLTALTLSGGPLTDTDLRHLAALPKLTHLDLTRTKVTKAGLEKLRKALPKCLIEADDCG
jgi:hypothetical protein